MQTTRTLSNNRNSARSSYLPNISTPNTISYAQRYEHMTKIANYSELNEQQIWKQYQKLRACLKQLNQEVLHHMEKKAYTNLYTKEAPTSPSVETTLILIEQQKKATETRLINFQNQASTYQTRISHLSNQKNYLQNLTHDIEIAQARIKQMKVENKDLKRRQKMISKDLLTGATFLEQLVKEEQYLHYANRKFEKYEQIFKNHLSKIREYTEKKDEYQKVLQTRVHQYRDQQDYIAEEINLQKFQDLQTQKNSLARFQSVYKRNYLMKLKELENLVNSVNKHDELIQQTEGNIMKIRGEIDSISAVVVSNRRKQSVSMMQQPSRRASKSGRRSIIMDNSLEAKENNRYDEHLMNDKNKM